MLTALTFAGTATAQDNWSKGLPEEPKWQGELVKVLPWCNLQAGQPRIGDWCKVQGDAFPLVAGFNDARYLFAGSGVWIGTLFPSGVVCMATSEFGMFTCGSPAGYDMMGDLLPENRRSPGDLLTCGVRGSPDCTDRE